MKGSKYFATLIGIGFALPGFISIFQTQYEILELLLFIPFLPFFLLVFPLELVAKAIFINSDQLVIYSFVFVVLLFAFLLSSFYFFKQLIYDRKNNYALNYVRVWGYFGLQIVIIHPLFLYGWAIITKSEKPFLLIDNTFPISSIIFVFFGLVIDYLRCKKEIFVPK